MAVVTFDDRCYSLDGNRIWLVSGSIHYYRVPEALWADRLLKARRAGLNCVSTHAAWNVHEPDEGKWDFAGQQDVAKFVKLAGEMGLYVILKPGPYIGGEWDGGGLPAWLGGKSGLALRTSNAAFTHYYDKYLLQLLARLSDLQVTRGGNIVLIQNECEYLATTAPDRLNYLEFVSQLFRRSGFDIPIITSNLLSDPPVPHTVECASGWSRVIHRLKRLRLRQPKAPLMASPFRCGEPDGWGRPHNRRDDVQAARTALEILGCGAQIDYTPWHGGTNFGFWGARSSRGEAWFATTSYDCDAPLAEGGGLTRKYYLTRLVNMLASSMGATIASCAMEGPGVTLHDGTAVLNIAGPAARWAVVTAGGRSDIPTARISTPAGDDMTVSLSPLGAVAVPVGLDLTDAAHLDYCNLMPLGFFGGKFLVLHGPPGHEGVVSVNGQVFRAVVPEGEGVQASEWQGLRVVLVSSDLAMRTWHVGDALVFGPDFVGLTAEDLVEHPHAKNYAVLSLETGELAARPAKGRPHHKGAAPKLGPWKRAGVCAEPTDKDLPWEKVARPQDAQRMGAAQGYLWYRLEIPQEKPSRRALFLPECEDRATIYLNGALVGTWGRGPGARREPIACSFRKGANVLTILSDNLGRFSDEPDLGQPKGLFGHLFDAKPLPLPPVKPKPFEGFSRRLVPRALAHLAGELEAGPVWSLDVPLSLARVAPVHLSLAGVGHHVAVLCNDRQAKFFPLHGSGDNFGDLTLGAELRKGKNLLRLLLWGAVGPEVIRNFRLHLLAENVSAGAAWSFRRWSAPQPGGRVVGKGLAAWYVSHFGRAETEEPLFLHLIGAKKGQVFLNGHNAGRFWTLGPQEDYYLPSCWLKEENELMVFEERGLIPAGSTLEFRRLGPYRRDS